MAMAVDRIKELMEEMHNRLFTKLVRGQKFVILVSVLVPLLMFGELWRIASVFGTCTKMEFFFYCNTATISIHTHHYTGRRLSWMRHWWYWTHLKVFTMPWTPRSWLWHLSVGKSPVRITSRGTVQGEDISAAQDILLSDKIMYLWGLLQCIKC